MAKSAMIKLNMGKLSRRYASAGNAGRRSVARWNNVRSKKKQVVGCKNDVTPVPLLINFNVPPSRGVKMPKHTRSHSFAETKKGSASGWNVKCIGKLERAASRT
jgi:hypothetical protein